MTDEIRERLDDELATAKKKTPGKPIPAPTRRSWLMRDTASGEELNVVQKFKHLSIRSDGEIIKPSGLCRILSKDKTLYLLSERGHTERRPRNANCFVRRARRGK